MLSFTHTWSACLKKVTARADGMLKENPGNRARTLRTRWLIVAGVLVGIVLLMIVRVRAILKDFVSVVAHDLHSQKTTFEAMSSLHTRYTRPPLANDAAVALHLDMPPDACQNVRRFGDDDDGGWDVCMDALFAGGVAEGASSRCNVYSFGIFDDVSFDRSISADPHSWTEAAGCTVFAFDPSIGKATGADIGAGPAVNFYNMGLAASDGRSVHRGMDGAERAWEVRTLTSIMAMLNHSWPSSQIPTKAPNQVSGRAEDVAGGSAGGTPGTDHAIVSATTASLSTAVSLTRADAIKPSTMPAAVNMVKADIEGMEWQVLQSWLDHLLGPEVCPPFRILALELHFGKRQREHQVALLGRLRMAGFVPYSVRENWRYCHLTAFKNGALGASTMAYSCLEVAWRYQGTACKL